MTTPTAAIICAYCGKPAESTTVRERPHSKDSPRIATDHLPCWGKFLDKLANAEFVQPVRESP